MTEQESNEIVAAAWCSEKTRHKVMDPELALEFARILRSEVARAVRQDRRRTTPPSVGDLQIKDKTHEQ